MISNTNLRIIRCGIGTESYCFEMSCVDSVGEAALARRFLQPTPDGQIGLLASNGEPVPVYSLAARLGRPAVKAREREHLVLLKTSRGRWALLVESVSRVLQIGTGQVHQLPPLLAGIEQHCFQSVVVFPPARKDPGAGSARQESPLSRSNDSAELSLLLSPELLHPEAVSAMAEPSASENTISTASVTVPGSHSATGDHSAARGQTAARSTKRGRVMLLSVSDQPVGSRPCSFGLSITQVLEVVSSLNPIPVPMAPEFVLGLACWRNQPVPVLDLARRMGLTSQIREPRLVIARASGAGDLVAFPVESVIRSMRLPVTNQPCAIPTGIREELLHGAFELESETLMIPDLPRVLTCV